jgi:hypothetical protein
MITLCRAIDTAPPDPARLPGLRASMGSADEGFRHYQVGSRVTPAALPHHRTCASASGGSLNTLESSRRIEQRHQPQTIKEGLRKRLVHVAGATVPPWAALVCRRTPCPLFLQSRLHQVMGASVRTVPLSALSAAQFAPDPAIHLFQHLLGLNQMTCALMPVGYTSRPSGRVEGFHLQVSAPCRAHQKKSPGYTRRFLRFRLVRAAVLFDQTRVACFLLKPIPTIAAANSASVLGSGTLLPLTLNLTSSDSPCP